MGHGLSGNSYGTTGSGKAVLTSPIPNQYDKQAVIIAWVEQNKAPDKTLVVRAGNRSMPLSSYPSYPKYVKGAPENAESYVSAEP